MAIKSNNKYSVQLRHETTIHKTSISLERIFWLVLSIIVDDKNSTVSEVVQEIDDARTDKNLSSAIRCYCIEYAMDPEIRLRVEALLDGERTGTDQAGYRTARA